MPERRTSESVNCHSQRAVVFLLRIFVAVWKGNDMEYSNWFTTSQAARALDISSEYIRVLVRAGKLDCVTTPLGKLISPDSIEEARAKGIGQIRRRV